MQKNPKEPQDDKLSKIDIDKEQGTVDRKVDNLLYDPNCSEKSLNDLDEEVSKGE